ncbi:hypothetical protein [Bradyrhizobium sp. B120]|uniref:hypothetical protein n=1 Tax=Bradyrhizobium sp. B120 TaxID=3410088 RepID=UPI003B984AFC
MAALLLALADNLADVPLVDAVDLTALAGRAGAADAAQILVSWLVGVVLMAQGA